MGQCLSPTFIREIHSTPTPAVSHRAMEDDGRSSLQSPRTPIATGPTESPATAVSTWTTAVDPRPTTSSLSVLSVPPLRSDMVALSSMDASGPTQLLSIPEGPEHSNNNHKSNEKGMGPRSLSSPPALPLHVHVEPCHRPTIQVLPLSSMRSSSVSATTIPTTLCSSPPTEDDDDRILNPSAAVGVGMGVGVTTYPSPLPLPPFQPLQPFPSHSPQRATLSPPTKEPKSLLTPLSRRSTQTCSLNTATTANSTRSQSSLVIPSPTLLHLDGGGGDEVSTVSSSPLNTSLTIPPQPTTPMSSSSSSCSSATTRYQVRSIQRIKPNDGHIATIIITTPEIQPNVLLEPKESVLLDKLLNTMRMDGSRMRENHVYITVNPTTTTMMGAGTKKTRSARTSGEKEFPTTPATAVNHMLNPTMEATNPRRWSDQSLQRVRQQYTHLHNTTPTAATANVAIVGIPEVSAGAAGVAGMNEYEHDRPHSPSVRTHPAMANPPSPPPATIGAMNVTVFPPLSPPLPDLVVADPLPLPTSYAPFSSALITTNASTNADTNTVPTITTGTTSTTAHAATTSPLPPPAVKVRLVPMIVHTVPLSSHPDRCETSVQTEIQMVRPVPSPLLSNNNDIDESPPSQSFTIAKHV